MTDEMAHEASRAQIRAANPAQSTWLAANAGSGKTRVLTDRVARLLLGGTAPQKILCLTYTKAAASEMQNRLFKRLGEWAMLEEGALRDALAALGVEGPIGPKRLAEARRLFARAIETPGGLKIQTIHSFCASLLRRFPIEAGVSPGFRELDDRAAHLLRQEVLEELADQSVPEAVDALARVARNEGALTEVLAGFSRNRDAFEPPLDLGAILAALGAPHDLTEARLLDGVYDAGTEALVAALARAMEGGSATDLKAAEKLKGFRADRGGLRLLEGVFLTGEGAKEPFTAKIGSLPTKATRAGPAANLMPEVEELMARVEAARARRITLETAEATAALHSFAAAFLPAYEARKAERGLLDFDDQIRVAAGLLADRAVAAWVLYRLDGGIDHILVDEAQDTSPGQWRVIEALAQEFTAGDGARGPGRRIFVVGDVKQSIYSFQGADLQTFRAVAEGFADRHRAADVPFQSLDLHYSFRSSEAILRVVDATFADAAAEGIGGAPTHRAYHTGQPGRVDLWEPIEKADRPEPSVWTNPVDVLPPDDPSVQLARRIADTIGELIERGEQIEVRGVVRPLTEGDFLVLVRKRGPLFHQIITACKARGLSIAGADRMVLGDQLVVKDLTALLSFLATPEDDLSLAALLRSPLFGWSEDALYRLAQPRGPRTYLWQALRDAPGHEATREILDDLRRKADFLRPYELLERVLTFHDGRRRLLARLGPEAEDGLDALLAAALAYEQTDVPSLTGFLVWLASGDTEIKRRVDSGRNALRVMTVHGAKGLEAPVVILPDTAKPHRRDDALFLTPEGSAIWRAKTAEMPELVAKERARRAAAARDEDLRLLYVAMTRAESWLIVAAAGEVGDEGESWHQLVAAGAQAAGMKDGRLASGVWPSALPERAAAPLVVEDGAPLPGPVPPAPPKAAFLSPTALGGAKVLPGSGDDGEDGRATGTALHLLLERLPAAPPEARLSLAERLAPGAPGLWSRAMGLLASPALAWVFAPDNLAEVALSARLPEFGGQTMQGTIDRLVVTLDRVLAVDFKSNARVPSRPEDVPAGILRQMAAYAAMLGQIYPDRRIDTAILWTATGELMMLPPQIVGAALAQPTVP